jgi:hypothetical protein
VSRHHSFQIPKSPRRIQKIKHLLQRMSPQRSFFSQNQQKKFQKQWHMRMFTIFLSSREVRAADSLVGQMQLQHR